MPSLRKVPNREAVPREACVPVVLAGRVAAAEGWVNLCFRRGKTQSDSHRRVLDVAGSGRIVERD